MKYDIFISYRRDGGEITARIIRDRLTELGYRVFFDVETLRNGDFNTKLYEQIDECKDFLIVLSPGALDRCVNPEDWVRREVEYALMKGKNIVPVLLRGFSFPAELPESLQQLPFQNGLEANSQFFDAFIQKLTTFFVTRTPPLLWILRLGWQKLLAAVLAVVMLTGALWAGVVWTNDNSTYPATAAQENLTKKVIYNVSSQLTYFNILAEAYSDALDAAERFLILGQKEPQELEEKIELCLHTLENTEIQLAAPGDFLLEQMQDSPFDIAEIDAMYDSLLMFREETVKNIRYIHQLVQPEFMLSDSDKMETIAEYRTYLSNTMDAFAISTNELLLPVTREEALATLWYDVLPAMEYISLGQENWCFSMEALEAQLERKLNNMEHSLNALMAIVGESEQDLFLEQRVTVQQLMDMGYEQSHAEEMMSLINQGYSNMEAQYIVVLSLGGYSKEQALDVYEYTCQGFTLTSAKALVDYERVNPVIAEADMVRQLEEEGYSSPVAETYAESYWELESLKYQFRLKCCGLSTDSVEILWAKMVSLKDGMMYEEAMECMDLFLTASGDDPYAPAIAAAAKLYLQQMPATGIDYGVMVTLYTDEIHPVLQIGDIIIGFNGEMCRGFQDYADSKAALAGTQYTVTVLRQQDGSLQQHELTLTTDMPLIGLSELIN